MKICYLKCLCGRNKLLAVKMQKDGYEVRVTSKNPDWRREASNYKIRLPFVVVNGEVKKL